MEDNLKDLDDPIGGKNNAKADKGVDDFALAGLDGLWVTPGSH